MKKTARNEAFDQLKRDLKAGTLGCGYLFYGAESYLREYYLGALRQALVPAGFEEFNYHRLEGKDLTVQALAEAAEAMPMMAEHRLHLRNLTSCSSIFVNSSSRISAVV